jgi:hypothetical protein
MDQFKLQKKLMDHISKQINVPGSFWQGHMLPDECDKVYKCTIIDFSLAHKFAPDSSPRTHGVITQFPKNGRLFTQKMS